MWATVRRDMVLSDTIDMRVCFAAGLRLSLNAVLENNTGAALREFNNDISAFEAATLARPTDAVRS